MSAEDFIKNTKAIQDNKTSNPIIKND